MNDTPIAIERSSDGVALIRLTRPKALNALSNALVGALADAYETLATEVRAIVVTGDERAFAAGADIGELGDPGPDLATWDRLWNCPIPVVAAVRGLAFGGGLELAMSADLLVVADDARLAQPEIKLGVIPGAGGTQRLTRAIGKALAMEMVLLGREIDGRDAYARGLANRCVPAERVVPTALDLARALAAGPSVAIRAAKRAVNDAFEQPLADALRAERAAFFSLLETRDAAEGITAFTERRPPTWSHR